MEASLGPALGEQRWAVAKQPAAVAFSTRVSRHSATLLAGCAPPVSSVHVLLPRGETATLTVGFVCFRSILYLHSKLGFSSICHTLDRYVGSFHFKGKAGRGGWTHKRDLFVVRVFKF